MENFKILSVTEQQNFVKVDVELFFLGSNRVRTVLFPNFVTEEELLDGIRRKFEVFLRDRKVEKAVSNASNLKKMAGKQFPVKKVNSKP